MVWERGWEGNKAWNRLSRLRGYSDLKHILYTPLDDDSKLVVEPTYLPVQQRQAIGGFHFSELAPPYMKPMEGPADITHMPPF